MKISESAKTIGRMVAEFTNEIQPDCIVGDCPMANECKDGFCVIGVERVEIILREETNEATAEKNAEISRLRDIVFRLIGDGLSPFNAYQDKTIYELVLNRGCGVTKIGNPMEGYDFTCAHEYEWDCNNCPIVTNDRVLASGEEG